MAEADVALEDAYSIGLGRRWLWVHQPSHALFSQCLHNREVSRVAAERVLLIVTEGTKVTQYRELAVGGDHGKNQRISGVVMSHEPEFVTQEIVIAGFGDPVDRVGVQSFASIGPFQ